MIATAPGLRFPARAEITKEFLDGVRELILARLAKFKQDVEDNPRTAKVIQQKQGPAMLRLRNILTKPADMDLFVTRLRGLPYTEFAIRNGHSRCLYGLTKDVIIKSVRGQDGTWDWNMGPYHVYIPVSRLTGSRDGIMAFIPDRGMANSFRHPHHSSSGTTCWGSFGPVVTTLFDECDIVESYRIIYTYLSRYDGGSVLSGSLRPDNYPFAIRTRSR